MKKIIARVLLFSCLVIAVLMAVLYMQINRFNERNYHHWNQRSEEGAKYPFLAEGEYWDSLVEDFPYSAITMNRTSGLAGWNPEFEVQLDKTGRATFSGRNFCGLDGEYAGQVSFFDFAHICNAMEHFNFIEMKDEYSRLVTDHPSTTIILFGEGTNVIKTVYEYAGVGPIQLWALQKSIDGVIANIRWAKTANTSKANEPTSDNADF
jgi:hypothetical protein